MSEMEKHEAEGGQGCPSPLRLENLLEEVLGRLSTVDLVPALYVSTAWRRAVYSSLQSSPRSKPWLFLHVQSRRNPAAVTTHAYDPHSRAWVRLPLAAQPPVSSPLRSSSGSGLLYQLTATRLAVRTGSVRAAWRDLGPPRAWRIDPIVAAVGHCILVAGGTSELLDDPSSVELYGETEADVGSGATLEPMPDAFRGSASGTWLSAAASDKKVYVMEKSTGLVCPFDVETKRWGATAELRPDPTTFFSIIGYSARYLVLVGLGRDAENGVVALKLWAVDCNTMACHLMGEMPTEMLEKLANDDVSSLSSVDACVTGEFAYVYKPCDPSSIFSCDFAGDECRWEDVQSLEGMGESRMHRVVLTCSEVGIDDLRAVFGPAVVGRRDDVRAQ